jgi:hypothetical protein
MSAAADDGTAKSPSTRYVWANSLFLRAQADGKSTQLAKIPYGAALDFSSDDASVAHTEIFAKYAFKGKTITVTVDGAWRKAHWQDKDGWVFDGYLSRYPAPNTASFEAWRKNFKNYPSDEIVYADQVFGPGKRIEWDMKKDGVKSPFYEAAKKSVHAFSQDLSPPYTNNARWINIEWAKGANCNYHILQDEGQEEALYLRSLPLTFNEALLWEMHFNRIDSKDTTTEDTDHHIEVDYTAGSSLSIKIMDMETSAISIKCSAKSCDLASKPMD